MAEGRLIYRRNKPIKWSLPLTNSMITTSKGQRKKELFNSYNPPQMGSSVNSQFGQLIKMGRTIEGLSKEVSEL